MQILDLVMSQQVSACFDRNILGNKGYPELVSTRMRRWQWERKVEGQGTGRHAVKEWGSTAMLVTSYFAVGGGRGIPHAA